MVAKTKKLKIGNGIDKDTILGPLTTKQRLDAVEKLVEITKNEGGKILCGGKKPANFKAFPPPHGHRATPNLFSQYAIRGL